MRIPTTKVFEPKKKAPKPQLDIIGSIKSNGALVSFAKLERGKICILFLCNTKYLQRRYSIRNTSIILKFS